MTRYRLHGACLLLAMGAGSGALAENVAEERATSPQSCISTSEAEAKLARGARYDANMSSAEPPLFDGEVRCRNQTIAHSYKNLVYPAVYEWTEARGSQWLVVYQQASHAEEWLLLPDPIEPDAFDAASEIDLYAAHAKCIRFGNGDAMTRRCFLYWGAESPISTSFDWYAGNPLVVTVEINADIGGSDRPAKIIAGDETFDLDWIFEPGMSPIATIEGDVALRLTEAAVEAGSATARITRDDADDEIVEVNLARTGEAYDLLQTLMTAMTTP